MPYSRYRPLKQFGKLNTKVFKQMYRDHLEKNSAPQPLIPSWIKKAGFELHDPNDKHFPQTAISRPSSSPAKTAPSPPETQSEPSNTAQVYCFDGTEPLSEGLRQALALTKTVLRPGLPSSITKLTSSPPPPNEEELLRALVLQSQEHDSTHAKLPRRFDSIKAHWVFPRYYGIPQWRKNEVLLNGLLWLSNRFNGLRTKDLIPLRQASFSSALLPFGPSEHILFRQTPLISLLSLSPLPALEPSDPTRSETLVDIFPLKPTIDLPSLKGPSEAQVSCPTEGWTPHTVLLAGDARERGSATPVWSGEERAANALLGVFSVAAAVAQRGGASKELEKPVVLKGVQCSGSALDFVVLQLNTLDLSGADGVKNIAWVHSDAKLFKPELEFWQSLEEEKSFEVDLEVFRQVRAMILHGAKS